MKKIILPIIDTDEICVDQIKKRDKVLVKNNNSTMTIGIVVVNDDDLLYIVYFNGKSPSDRFNTLTQLIVHYEPSYKFYKLEE